MNSSAMSGVIERYIAAANCQDAAAVAACFSDDAVVRDEGRDRPGSAAIHEWAAEVSRQYQPTIEVVDVAQANGKTTLSGRVSGDFPGSPATLRYVFSLQGDKIARLEIG